MVIDGVTSFRKTDDEDCPPLPSVLTVHPRGRTCSPQRSELSPVPCWLPARCYRWPWVENCSCISTRTFPQKNFAACMCNPPRLSQGPPRGNRIRKQ